MFLVYLVHSSWLYWYKSVFIRTHCNIFSSEKYPKLDTYKKFEVLENYLFTLQNGHQIALATFRISSHSLWLDRASQN